jgi:hypothetical protein
VDALAIVTIADALTSARPPYEALLERAEEVEDEWSYVNDLATAWLDRLDEIDAQRGGEPAGPGVAAAVARLADEAATIDDPHRAIDWLSTYPQVLILAVGEHP